MFTKIRQAAVVGAVVAGVGWVSVVSPAVAHTQVPRIPTANDITCPGGGVDDVQYVPDPDDSNAFYVCAGGAQQDHRRCPQVTKLDMNTTPPTCLPLSNHHMP